MIKIDKGNKIPEILKGRGALETKYLCDNRDLAPRAYSGSSPALKCEFYGDIFNSKSVKKLLIKCQHNKCCYSEAKFVGDYGDVEHFRPKGRIGSETSSRKKYPGYYWLAYSWENIFLSKQIPNQKHKKDFFPLENEASRARNHRDAVANERPLLIDPALDDPRDHIRFHLDEPVGKTDRGRKTIALLNLRYSHFEEDRRTLLRQLGALRDALKELEDNGLSNSKAADEIRAVLNEAILPTAEYSSMAMDFLA